MHRHRLSRQIRQKIGQRLRPTVTLQRHRLLKAAVPPSQFEMRGDHLAKRRHGRFTRAIQRRKLFVVREFGFREGSQVSGNDQDNFFDTPETRKLSRWVVIGLCVVTLGVVALLLIWAFTGWL